VEFFLAWYGGEEAELSTFVARANGHYSPQFWLMLACNAVVPLLYFLRRVRRSLPALFSIAVLITVGMWFERFVIIIGSPTHAYDPYTWRLFQGPTWVEYGVLLGSFSLFFFLFLLFAKFLPCFSLAEVKEELVVGEAP
jgi:molybdopterin-containing oxidoreductase family membrane subunit